MPCPLPTLPPLIELVQQLAAVHPAEAERHRGEVESLEARLASAREQLAQDEAALAQAQPGAGLGAYEEWCLRSSAAWGARRAVRMLETDAAVRRESLECALFLALQDKAAGRVRCRECQGSGEGPAIPGGISLEYPPCDACAGTGVVRVS